jgi:CheY-like chemotaxis protein
VKTKQKTMLVLDDEKQFLSVLERYFKAGGWNVDCTTEREEAEALMLINRYEVVLTHLFLNAAQESDGLTLLRFVKYHFPRTIVVLLTAHLTGAVRHAAQELGAEAVLPKPQPLSAVATVIDDIWRNKI